MPKGVQFDEESGSDNSADSDSILTTSPVFMRTSRPRQAHKKLEIAIFGSDSDNSDFELPASSGALSRRMGTSNSFSSRHAKTTRPSQDLNREDSSAESCDLLVLDSDREGDEVDGFRPVEIISSDSDSDQWLPKVAATAYQKRNGITSARSTSSAKSAKNPSMSAAPTSSAGAATYRNKNGISKSSQKSESNSSSSKKLAASTSSATSSRNNNVKTKNNNSKNDNDNNNHNNKMKNSKKPTPKLVKQRTFIIPDIPATSATTVAEEPPQRPLPKTLSPRQKSLQKLMEERQRKQQRRSSGGAVGASPTNQQSKEDKDRINNSSRSKRVLSLPSDSDSDVDDITPESSRGKRPRNTATPVRVKRKSDSSPHRQPIRLVSDSDEEMNDRPLDSSPDISDGEFERIIAGVNIINDNSNRERTHRNPFATSIVTSTSAAATMSDDNYSDSSLSQNTGRRSRRRQNALDFVPASSLIDNTLPHSPSRMCSRRSCPCKQRSPATMATDNEVAKRPVRKKKSRSETTTSPSSRASTSRQRASGGAAGESDTPAAVQAVAQMEKDEEMARKLQEDLDRQYAAMLASGASASSPANSARGRGSGLPASVVMDDNEDMEMRINMLSDWEWAVHVALVQGTDVPPAPPGEAHQTPDGALDAALLEYLYSHPDAINNRRSPNNNRRASQAQGELLPTFLPEVTSVQTRRRQRATRGRGARRRRPGFTEQEDDELEHALRLLQRGLTGGRRGGRGFGLGMPFLHGFRGADLNLSVADGNDYEELLALEEELGAVVTQKGLTAEQISRLPITKFNAATAAADATQCNVCMCDYDEGDQLRLLTCFHSFHTDCIDKWIKDNPTCPVCRIEIKV